MIDDPHVGLGHLLIAIAEPHPAGLEAYHRWFERDHMYSAVLIGPGAFAAERYKATRPLKGLRYPADGQVFPSIDVGSFVALYYLVRGSVEEHFAWSYPQIEKLNAAGRNNLDRDLVLTWLCDYRGRVARDADSVPPEIAFDHRYAGIVMVWVEAAPGRSPEDLERWLVDAALPDALRDSPVDQVQIFSARDFPEAAAGVALTKGAIAPNVWVGRGLLLLYFLEIEPERAWEDHFAMLGRTLAESGVGNVKLAAPFVPTDRGRRANPDEIW
ncbi:MAG: hypothetical protein JRF61_03980 [Deltaproteobacteria bacterium]|nr:hypothetical protein [Deltaproteobacteria bacterium]